MDIVSLLIPGQIFGTWVSDTFLKIIYLDKFVIKTHNSKINILLLYSIVRIYMYNIYGKVFNVIINMN